MPGIVAVASNICHKFPNALMGVIMVTVLFSRFFYIPGYLSQLGLIEPLAPQTINLLKWHKAPRRRMPARISAVLRPYRWRRPIDRPGV